MAKLLIHVPFAALALSVCACTSGPVNTTNPSTSDLLFRYDQLETHLQARRDTLATLQSRLADLDKDLAQQLSHLSEAQNELIQLKRVSAEQELEKEALNAELRNLISQNLALRSDYTALVIEREQLRQKQADKLKADKEAAAEDAVRMRELESDISVLEQKKAALTEAYDRQLAVHRRYTGQYSGS